MRFILSGPLRGRTIKLGSQGYQFVNGELTVQASPQDVALYARQLERNWQAYPEGHPALLEGKLNGQREIHKDSQPNEQSTVSGELQPVGEAPAARDSTVVGTGC